ncbi:MAG TPA: antibiotic biosynthesis monooxygenase [Dehalococcoidia bacterium]
MMVSILRRKTTVTKPEEWDSRSAALAARLNALLERQPGFVSHELRRDGDGGGMVEETAWRTAGDCRAYLRNGAAAMAATTLDAFFPTAPFPNGNWVRSTEERAG